MKSKTPRLFDPPPEVIKGVLERIIEQCEAALGSLQYETYEESLRWIRRECLRAARL